MANVQALVKAEEQLLGLLKEAGKVEYPAFVQQLKDTGHGDLVQYLPGLKRRGALKAELIRDSAQRRTIHTIEAV